MVPLALLASLRQTAPDATAEMAASDLVVLPSRAALDAEPVLGGGLILLLCILAGLGTVMLLPGRGVAWRRAGALLAVLAAAVFFLALGVKAADRPTVYFWIFSAIALFGSIRVVTHPKPVYSALYFVLTVFASAGLFVLLWAEFMAVALIVIYAGAILVTYTFVIMLAADAAPTTPGAGEEAAREFLAEHDRRARAPFMAAATGFITMGVLLFVILDRAPGTLVPRQSLTDARFLVPPGAGDEPGVLGVDAEGPLADAGVVTTDAAGVAREAVPSGPRGDLYPANEQASHSNEHGGIQVLGVFLFTRHIVSLQLAGLVLTVAMVGAIVIARRRIIAMPGSVEMTTQSMGADEYATPFTPPTDDPKSLPVKGTGDPRQKAYPQN